MDDQEQVRQIASAVFHDTAFYIALISLIGVVLGAGLTILGNYIAPKWTQKSMQRSEFKRDEPRRKVLRQILEDDRFPDHWRKLDTLMHVIGSDEATTTRLLLEIHARGSEDGHRLWGLMRFHPFGNTQ